MKYSLHPEAALEHEEQVAYYESRAAGLGKRYHGAFLSALHRACEAPRRHRISLSPAIRSARLRGFPFSVIFREYEETVQVLAVAHHRRRPGYWAARL